MKLSIESLKNPDIIRQIFEEYYFKSSMVKMSDQDNLIYEFLNLIDEKDINDRLFTGLFKNVKLPSMIYYENNIHKYTIDIDDETLIIWLCYLFPNPLCLNFILWYIQYLSKHNIINYPIDFQSFNKHFIINGMFKNNEIIEKEILPHLKYQYKNDKDITMNKDYYITLHFESGRTLLY